MDKIAACFFINLEKRADRRALIEEQLKDLSLSAERFEATQTDPGIVGCGLSHLAVMKIAKERAVKNVLILEDDFEFLVDRKELDAALNQFFDDECEYDVCMLQGGDIRYEDTGEKFPYMRKIASASNAAAYIVNGPYLETLINLFEWGMPLLESTGQHWVYANDQLWQRLQKTDNWFVFEPRLGKQRSGYSDNNKAFADYG